MELKLFAKQNLRIVISGVLLIVLVSACKSTNFSRNQETAMVVTKARSYVGTPYKYGGTTIMGMDCSGLLTRSFEPVDLYIPRTSMDQSKMGKPVMLDMIRPGDLVFFAAKKGSNKVSHAGMITEVRSRDEILFIHASSSRGVVEDNLMSDYYRKIFVKARRIKF